MTDQELMHKAADEYAYDSKSRAAFIAGATFEHNRLLNFIFSIEEPRCTTEVGLVDDDFYYQQHTLVIRDKIGKLVGAFKIHKHL